MAITSTQDALNQINGANLTDGPAIKKLLQDLASFLATAAAPGNATTTVAGIVKQAANVPAATGGTDTTTQTNLNAIRTALVNAGIMVGP